jgi:vomeronasal 2 receptor
VHTTALYQGIIQLLLYFTWVWVGLVVPDDSRGELFIMEFIEEMINHRLCVAFAIRSPQFPFENQGKWEIFCEKIPLTRVIIAVGDTYDTIWIFYIITLYIPYGKIWITNSDWFTTLPSQLNFIYKYFSGGLLVLHKMDEILGFKDFLRNVQPRKYPHNIFIQDMWSILFECPYFYRQKVRVLSQCEPNGSLSTQPLHVWDMNTSPSSYKVHAAVYAIAQALREELSVRVEGDSFDKVLLWAPVPWKVAIAVLMFF